MNTKLAEDSDSGPWAVRRFRRVEVAVRPRCRVFRQWQPVPFEDAGKAKTLPTVLRDCARHNSSVSGVKYTVDRGGSWS